MQVAVITGGASGIGRALCHALIGQGWAVYAVDLRLDTMPPPKENYRGCETDVRERGALASLADGAMREHGRIDLWVNCAAINIVGECAELSSDEIDDVLRVNLHAAIDGSLVAYAAMRERREGRIVNVASAAGLLAYPTTCAYSTSKAGLIAFSQALRSEARADGVKVCVACPGLVDTPIFARQKVIGLDSAAYGRTLPRGRISAKDAAVAILLGAKRNKALFVFPRSARVAVLLAKFVPYFREGIARSALRTYRKARGGGGASSV